MNFRKSNIVFTAAFLISTLSSVSSFAWYQENEVSPEEAAQAILICKEESKTLLDSDRHITAVRGKFEEVSEDQNTKVTKKTYTFVSAQGGWGPPRPETRLIIELTMTTIKGLMDAGPQHEWKCGTPFTHTFVPVAR